MIERSGEGRVYSVTYCEGFCIHMMDHDRKVWWGEGLSSNILSGVLYLNDGSWSEGLMRGGFIESHIVRGWYILILGHDIDIRFWFSMKSSCLPFNKINIKLNYIISSGCIDRTTLSMLHPWEIYSTKMYMYEVWNWYSWQLCKNNLNHTEQYCVRKKIKGNNFCSKWKI